MAQKTHSFIDIAVLDRVREPFLRGDALALLSEDLGEVLWAMGRRDEARRYFDEARGIDPDNRALKRALEKTGA